jgi:hypothetical protein
MSGRHRQTVEISSKCLHLQEFMRQKIKGNYSIREEFLLEQKVRSLSVMGEVIVVLKVIQRGKRSEHSRGWQY